MTDLTEWYPAHVKPVRVGVYQRDYSLDGSISWFMDYWDGANWCWLYGTQKIVKVYISLPWRGLASDTKTAVTQWFPISEKPVHDGVYELRGLATWGPVLWARWKDSEWKMYSFHKDIADDYTERSRSCYDGHITHWRGLANQPTKEI